jgi:hypothetical protein
MAFRLGRRGTQKQIYAVKGKMRRWRISILPAKLCPHRHKASLAFSTCKTLGAAVSKPAGAQFHRGIILRLRSAGDDETGLRRQCELSRETTAILIIRLSFLARHVLFICLESVFERVQLKAAPFRGIQTKSSLPSWPREAGSYGLVPGVPPLIRPETSGVCAGAPMPTYSVNSAP